MLQARIVTAAVLCLCAGLTSGAAVDPTQSTFSCNTSAIVVAGSPLVCAVELRTSGGVLTGDEAELCKLSTNFTSGLHNGGMCVDLVATPFGYAGTAGVFTLSLTPTVAGELSGSVLYRATGATHVLGDFVAAVVPGEESLAGMTSSCAHSAAEGTTCTTSHRDAWGNTIKTCFQRWAGAAAAVSECSIVPYTTTNY